MNMTKWSFIKRIAACAMVFIVAVGMCGCGETSSSGGTDSGTVSISIGGWPTTEGEELDAMNARKEAFEQTYSDITIMPDTWTFDLQTFYPKAEAGLLPNVFQNHFSDMGKLIDGGYVADLTDELEALGYYDKLNPSIMECISKEGRVYAIPSSCYILGLAYNADLFEAAGLLEADGTPRQPQDWNELAEMAVQIKEATGQPGFIMTTSNNAGGWLFTNIAWSYGVDFMEQDTDGNWHATFNTDEAAEALQFISDLKWVYDVLPANTLIDNTEARKTFATGGGAMLLIGSDVGTVVSRYEMDPTSLGMMALPAGPKRHVALLGGTLQCVSETSTDEQISAVIKWMDYSGTGYLFDDSAKANLDADMALDISNGVAVGIKPLRVWKDDAEKTVYQNQLIDDNYNMRPNAARLYNESLSNTDIEWQAEEPVCAQDLYGILDNCIQQVLTDQNADIKAILEKANTDFQTNYLDNLTY